MNKNTVYILQKDLPDANIGTELTWDESNNAYRYQKSAWVYPHRHNYLTIVDNPPSKQIGNSENILVKEDADYKPKMFDVDSEKNWVIDDGKVIQNNEPSGTHSINTNTD